MGFYDAEFLLEAYVASLRSIIVSFGWHNHRPVDVAFFIVVL